MKKLFLFSVLVVLFSFAATSVFASAGGVPEGNPFKRPSTPQPKEMAPPAVEAVPEAQAPAKSVEPVKAPVVQKPVVPKKDTAAEKAKKLALKKKRELNAKKKIALNNTEWDVTLIPLAGEGERLSDVVVFYDKKVAMQSLETEGLGATNYTVNVEDNGKTIWETMQTGENVRVFFRGEIMPDFEKMSGVVSFQLPEGNKDYSMLSTAKRKVLPRE